MVDRALQRHEPHLNQASSADLLDDNLGNDVLAEQTGAFPRRQNYRGRGLLRKRWHLPTKIPETILLGLLRREWHPDRLT